MALKEKLSQIIGSTQQQKAELEPVYQKIKELTELKCNLDMIKGSLEPFSERGAGLRMKEYDSNTRKRVKSETDKTDLFIDENKDDLKKIGIENRDQLVEHPELGAEPEVENYKGALKQSEELNMSDTALKEKLKLAGIDIPENAFSYEAVEAAIAKKIPELDRELFMENLKTPEGKEKAIETLAGKFEKHYQNLRLSKKDDESYALAVDYMGHSGVSINGDKAQFNDWHRYSLPDNFPDVETKYGSEIAYAALKRAAQNKTSEVFDNYDKENGNFVYLKEKIKPLDPKEGTKARKLMREFKDAQDEFRQTIIKKSTELKKKKIDFSPKYASGYGGEYEDFIQFGEYAEDGKRVEEALTNVNGFPGKYDYKKLQEFISKRIQFIQEFSQYIKGIKTEADVDRFLHDKNPAIKKFHKDQTDADLEPAQFKFNTSKYALSEKNERALGELTSKCQTYFEAQDYLDTKTVDLGKAKQRATGLLHLGIDAQHKFRDLQAETLQTKFIKGSQYVGLSDIESGLKNIEYRKKDSLAIINQIIKLGLPETDEIILKDRYIKFPAIQKKIDDSIVEKQKKENELKTAQGDTAKYKKTKAGLFGKGKWQNGLDDLEKKEKAIEEEFQKQTDEINKLYDQVSIELDSKGYLSSLKEVEGVQGTSKQVIEKLEKIAAEEAPGSIVEMYSQYKKMEKDLNG